MFDGRPAYFDTVAQAYDRARPTYPSAAVSYVLNRDTSGHPRILEAGSGTGLLTQRLRESGRPVTCIEPGPQMIESAKNRLADDAVEFVLSTFEASSVPTGGFGAVASGQAFHWIGPAGFPKVATLLASGGVFGLLWNTDHPDKSETEVAMNPIYEEFNPDKNISPAPSSRDECRDALEVSPLFTGFAAEGFDWEVAYSTQEYLNLLVTYSDVGMMPATDQAGFLGKIGAVVDGFGGSFVKRYVCKVYSAIKP